MHSDGTILVVPPSIHYSGGKYEFIKQIAPIPWREEYHPAYMDDKPHPRTYNRNSKESNAIKRSGRDRELACECIKHLKPERADDYDSWIKVGMALKNAGCSCDVWTRWSSQSKKFKDGECEKKMGDLRTKQQS